MAFFRRSTPKTDNGPLQQPAHPAEQRTADPVQYNYLEEPYVSLKNRVQMQLIASSRQGERRPDGSDATELRRSGVYRRR